MCLKCKKLSSLNSKIEIDNSLCLDCIQEILQNNVSIEEQTLEIQKLRISYQTLQESLKHIEKILHAEEMGRKSGEEGLPESQNPFLKETEEYFYWEHGHQEVSLRRKYKKILGTLMYVQTHFEDLKELAQINAADEISLKIEDLQEQISPHVEEFFNSSE